MEAALFTMHEVLWHALKPPPKQDGWASGSKALAVSISMVFLPLKKICSGSRVDHRFTLRSWYMNYSRCCIKGKKGGYNRVSADLSFNVTVNVKRCLWGSYREISLLFSSFLGFTECREDRWGEMDDIQKIFLGRIKRGMLHLVAFLVMDHWEYLKKKQINNAKMSKRVNSVTHQQKQH